VQEALTNTLKHGGPDATAHVEVAWEDEAVEIVARDTGWGLAGPRGAGSRRGLEGMRERLHVHGGTVVAGPGAAGGYEVRARLPVAAREEVPA
jgi:signal transduction histidine kinase